MPRSQRVRKVKSLDAFLGLSAKPGASGTGASAKTVGGGEKHGRRAKSSGAKDAAARPAERKGDFIESILEEFFGGMRGGKKRTGGAKERREAGSRKKEMRVKGGAVGEGGRKASPKQVFAVDVKPPVGGEPGPNIRRRPLNEMVPTGEVLRELLARTADQLKRIECDAEGVCSDGHRISDVFIDEHGFRRQRGFVRTTRIPVFLDWIVEEATVSKLLERAYVVETERGALAIVPVDFLCELDKRYGVLLKNYDCSKTTVSPYSTSTHRK